MTQRTQTTGMLASITHIAECRRSNLDLTTSSPIRRFVLRSKMATLSLRDVYGYDIVVVSVVERFMDSLTTDRSLRLRFFVGLLMAVAAAAFVVYALRSTHFGSAVRDFLFERLTWLQRAREEQPVAVYGAAFLLYVVVTGLSLPGAAVMTLAYGWMFGFWRGLILVSVSSTTGATVAFLLSRYLLRGFVQRRFGRQLAGFNTALERDGAFYLFSLRLIPAIPFFVVNAVMGLTPISVGTFWWVSQLGMLPGTAVYVYAGTSLPGLEELKNPSVTKILSPQLLVAFTLLGLLPLALKKVSQQFQKPNNTSSAQLDSSKNPISGD